MPIIAEIQDRLQLAFPHSSNVPLLRAVREGVLLANSHYDDENSFLNNRIGMDIRGHMRRIGISYQIDRYCTRGDLPFVTTVKPMPKGNWHWLEIKSTGAFAHLCRTDDVFKFPVEADSRQDLRLTYQKNLFSAPGTSFGQLIKQIPQLYAWLTFKVGQDGTISHLCWASPAADSDEWLAHINVSRDVAESGATAEPTQSVPDPAEKLRFKKHIADALEPVADKNPGA
jgi:hypothetical protein